MGGLSTTINQISGEFLSSLLLFAYQSGRFNDEFSGLLDSLVLYTGVTNPGLLLKHSR